MALDRPQLELLEALASAGTLTAAARRLYVSQPALTLRLRNLEDQLGIRLFDRQGRQMAPTRAGQRLIETATVVLRELDAAERDVRTLAAGMVGSLRFASQCSTNYSWLPALLRQFHEEHPGVEVRIEPTAADRPIPALLADRIDVALVAKPDSQMHAVDLEPLFVDELVAVVARNHPWAGRDSLGADDFTDAHVVLYEVYDTRRSAAALLPLPAGAWPARLTTVPVITELLLEMVRGGQAVTVLPSWVATNYQASHGVTTVPMRPAPEPRVWYCATRKGPGSGALDDFVGLLRERFRTQRPGKAQVIAVPEAAPSPAG
ncbi:LysR family transcriptional regulator [Frankia canadensis]|uniref:LysR family transcriptional regulator n=1 Tax=Frankia canadensis TaxID=1836972 RepID=A0A2I2KS25_9ACTN|nr:LysR family transcriptional regulator [Frankia canadensis]SNQ48471.1 LysR family transcriptional regulator [Frankia canadensis]SOU55761.1 LysR family transcriptional regulator [Frankia canadensis]